MQDVMLRNELKLTKVEIGDRHDGVGEDRPRIKSHTVDQVTSECRHSKAFCRKVVLLKPHSVLLLTEKRFVNAER